MTLSAHDTAVDRVAVGERAPRIRLRGAWLQVHRWLGLTLGVIAACVGLSGSVLVYGQAIDAWLHPQRYATTGAEATLSFADYAERAAAAVGDGARALNIRLPETNGIPVVVLARARGESGGARRVYLDPPTGRVLDAPASGGLVGWMHDFHESLRLREQGGRDIVGVVGGAMLLSSLTGLYLWWPRRRLVLSDFGYRRRMTLARNLHYTFGFYGSLVLATLSFTGILLAWPEAARNGVAVFGSVSPLPRAVQAVAANGRVPLSPDGAVDVARGLFPQARVIGLALPAGQRGVYRIALREPGDASPRPVTQVVIDPVSHAILRRVDRATQSAGDAFLAAQRPLHEGAALGPVVRAMVLVAGLLPALLLATGGIMWLRGRRVPLVGRTRRSAACGG
jgi:uncharacterized iron-regulated membrane protein